MMRREQSGEEREVTMGLSHPTGGRLEIKIKTEE